MLGGGGARGISHLGTIRALQERGIPIDIIGGTSIGAFVGCLYARELDYQKTFDLVQLFRGRLSPWRFLLDITYPWLSITTGRHFNHHVKNTFGDMELEDTWIESYCAVTNLTRGAVSQIFNTGRAWDLIRASMSIMALVPPLVTDAGELLLDGCYSSNIPISFATKMKANTILAVDVSIVRTMPFPRWRDELSTWRMIIKRYFPGGRDPPSYDWINEILSQGVSTADLESARKMPGCLYTKQPVGQYKALGFSKFSDILAIGYRHANKWFDELESGGQLNKMYLPRGKKG